MRVEREHGRGRTGNGSGCRAERPLGSESAPGDARPGAPWLPVPAVGRGPPSPSRCPRQLLESGRRRPLGITAPTGFGWHGGRPTSAGRTSDRRPGGPRAHRLSPAPIRGSGAAGTRRRRPRTLPAVGTAPTTRCRRSPRRERRLAAGSRLPTTTGALPESARQPHRGESKVPTMPFLHSDVHLKRFGIEPAVVRPLFGSGQIADSRPKGDAPSFSSMNGGTPTHPVVGRAAPGAPGDMGALPS